MEYLRSRDIKSVPVTIIDDDDVIIGYYPKKLVPALKLDIQVDLSGKTDWLSEKYTAILGAAMRATCQLSEDQLSGMIPWRPQSARDLIVHVVSFPELAYLSHEHGSMSTEDMAASNQRLKSVVSADAIVNYGEGVLKDIREFLASGNEEGIRPCGPGALRRRGNRAGVVEHYP